MKVSLCWNSVDDVDAYLIQTNKKGLKQEFYTFSKVVGYEINM
jgi:hypothetical protein